MVLYNRSGRTYNSAPSESVYAAVSGPSVNVRLPGNPQVLSSMQRIAYVVANASYALLGKIAKWEETRTEPMTAPTRG
jgi:hypothetical protein